jgi:PEP-CTERM motif
MSDLFKKFFAGSVNHELDHAKGSLTMDSVRLALTGFVAGTLATAATAETFTLGFANLPTAQGWTYNPNGGGALPETAFYTATGTQLNQATEGFAPGTNDGYYARAVTFSGSTDFVLTATASIGSASGDTLGGGTIYPFGFILGLDSVYFGLNGSRLGSYSTLGGVQYFDLPAGFDASGNVDYRMIRTGASLTFTANGVTLFNGLVGPGALSDRVIIGDGTKFANATGNYSALRFSSDVPEPASWAMLVAGFGLVGAAVRRRRRVLVA